MSGIVRKIDELGRIVIPKEIRKVMGIQEGSSLNISTNGESIVLNKFSTLKNINEYVYNVAYALFECVNCDIVITDDQKVLIALGVSKTEFLQTQLASYFIKSIGSTKCYYNKDVFNIIVDQATKVCAMCVVPIWDQGKVVGSIVLIQKQPNKQISVENIQTAECMSRYLSKMIM